MISTARGLRQLVLVTKTQCTGSLGGAHYSSRPNSPTSVTILLLGETDSGSAETKLGGEGGLVDDPYGLGIQVESAGHGLHAQAGLAKVGCVRCQTAGDARVDMNEFQSLDSDLAAVVASDLAVFDLQEHGEVSEAQIPNEPARVGVDRAAWRPAGMADGSESPVGFDNRDRGARCLGRVQVRDSHSTPGEKTCYTELGHRVSPFEAKQSSLTNVCLAAGEPVSNLVSSRQMSSFFGGERKIEGSNGSRKSPLSLEKNSVETLPVG